VLTTTKTQGLAPIGLQAVPDAVKRIADAALIHPNVQKMHDAVDRWIKEANSRGGQAGVDYLALCQAQVQANGQNLADWACDRADLRKGLHGLTINDIEAAQWRLDRAARRLGGLS
jgi:hypothetical protein